MQKPNQRKALHMIKKANFDYVKNYIKEIQLIDQTVRMIEPISSSHPIMPIVLNTQVAVNPYSTRFCGSYVEHWELSLN